MIKVIVLIYLLATLAPPLYAQERQSPWLGKAREEGKVVFYTTMSVAEVNNLAKMFEKQHPSIKVELFRAGGSGAITNRVQMEYTAKSYFVDVIQGIANRAMIPFFKDRGIIERYDSPEYQFVPDDLKDKDRYWASAYQNTYVLVYNKNLVRKIEVPKTYDDLLRPQWKGKKMIFDTEGFPWFNGLLSHWGRDKGLAYFKRLAQQDPVFHRGSRLSIQLIMAGEAPLTIAYGSHAHDYASKGAPIGWVTLQPVIFNVNSISLAKRAPHPNAAKVFIDFLFSKEAQTQLRAISHIPSRTDVDANPPELFKGFQRIFAFRDSSDIPEIVRLYNEIFRLAR